MDQAGGDNPVGAGGFQAVSTPAPQSTNLTPNPVPPSSFDMQPRSVPPLAPPEFSAATGQPSTDIRPDWQQQIYSELAQQPQPATQIGLVQGVPAPTYAPLQAQPLQYPQYSSSPGETLIELSQPGTTNWRRWLILSLGALLVVGVVGGIATASYQAGKQSGYSTGVEDGKKIAQSSNSTDDSTDEEEPGDEELLNFELSAAVYKDETITGGMVEQLQSADGLVVYVKSIERNFTQATDDTMELVKVNLLVGNAASEQPKSVSNASFTLRTPAGDTVQAATDLADYEGKIDTLSLSPGSKARMSVVFAVEKNVAPLTLVRQQVYNIRNRGTTATMNLEVTLE